MTGSFKQRPTGDAGWATAANAVTLLRLLLIAPSIALLLTDRPGMAVALLVIFGATDRIDGWVARRFDQVSRVGEVLDPIADRVGVAAILLGLALTGSVPWWIVAVVLVTDLVVGLCYLARRPGAHGLGVTRIGKFRTALLMAGLVLAAARLWSDAPWLTTIALVTVGGGALLHALAGLGYVRQMTVRTSAV